MIPEKSLETALLTLLAITQVVRMWAKRRLQDPDEDRRRPRDSITMALELHKRDIDELKARMDRAGGHLSDLATMVQRMPDDLRREFAHEFADKRVSYDYASQCANDRMTMKDDIRELRDEIERLKRPGPIRVDRQR